MAAFNGYATQILQGLGAPVTQPNLQALTAWQVAEGGTAANNPFNTTQDAPGAMTYNGAGVKSYTTPQQGLQATIQALKNGDYQNIVQALQQGNNSMAVAQAIANSPWGTGQGVVNVLNSGSELPAQAQATMQPSFTPQQPTMQQQSLMSMQQPQQQNGPLQLAMNLLTQSSGGFNPDGSAVNPIMQYALQRMQMGAASNVFGATPSPTTKLGTPPPQGATALGANIVKTAQTQLGTPYQYGGAAVLGKHTDCSGLAQAVLGANGIKIPRTTYQQFQSGTPVSQKDLQPGDLVFFKGSDPKGNLPGHVGIYIGANKFIEDPHTGASVRVSTFSTYPGYAGARRYT